MMAEKARLFNDNATLVAIMKSMHPAVHKRLGRRVKGFSQQIWDDMAYQIVLKGNLAKYGQNPELAEKLLATGDALLCEASAKDRIWGIGLAVGDPRVDDPSKWRGQNLLGKVLMEVRARVRDSA